MTLSAYDQDLLAKFEAAEFEVTRPNGRTCFIRFATYTGEVGYTEFGIHYGPHGMTHKVWDLKDTSGDCSAAFEWGVEETKRMMRADADKLIARLRAEQAA